MDPTLVALYTLAALVLIATPGPDMLFVITQGGLRGPRGGLMSAFGIGLGVSIHASLAALGIAALLHALPQLFDALRLAGAAYLVGLGLLTLWRRGGDDTAADTRAVSDRDCVLRGFLTNALNPKVALFFIALLPQFVPANAAQPALIMLMYGVIYGLLTVVAYGILGHVSGGLARRWIHHPGTRRWMERLAAGVFIGLGVRLALQGRP